MIRSPASVISLTYNDVEDFHERARMQRQPRVSRLPIFADTTSSCCPLRPSPSSLPLHSSQQQISAYRNQNANGLLSQQSSERKPFVLSASKSDSYASLRGIQCKGINRVTKLYAGSRHACNPDEVQLPASPTSISTSDSSREVPHKVYGDPQKSTSALRLSRPDPSTLRLSRHAVQDIRVPSGSTLDPAAPAFIPRIQIGFHASTKSSFIAWTRNQDENSLTKDAITVPAQMTSRSVSAKSTSDSVGMSRNIVGGDELTHRDPGQIDATRSSDDSGIPVVQIDAADEFLQMRTSPLEELTQRFSCLPLAERIVDADPARSVSNHHSRPKLLTGDAFRANSVRGLPYEIDVLEDDTEAMDNASPDLHADDREPLSM